MSHTPGPWKVCEEDIGVVYAPDGQVADVSGTELAYFGPCRIRDQKTRHANARLIAAAPEMYAALERVLATIENADEWWMDCPGKGGFDAIEIADVLAKAKGETE